MKISKECGANLARIQQNINCQTPKLIVAEYVIHGKYQEYPSCANDEYATLTEMQAYLDAGNGIMFPITNATKPSPTAISFSGADTYKQLEEIVFQTETLVCKFQNIDNDFKVMQAANNLNNQNGQIWIVWKTDSGSYIIDGGVEGYETNTFLPEPSHDGFATQGLKIDKTYSWTTKQGEAKLFSSEDAYDTLINDVNLGEYTYANVSGTASTAIDKDSFFNVNGWIKSDTDTLYAEASATDVIEFFLSDAQRTAGTPVAGTLTASTSEAIVGGVLSGSIDLIKSGVIVLGDKFDIVYSQIG